jgi:SAM-dependent methyltransferase
MKYKIKSSLLEKSWFEKAIFDTLKMYDSGKDLTKSPLNNFQRNYKTWGGKHQSFIGKDIEIAIKERQKDFIALYESIKRNGYKNIFPFYVWFDDDGYIHLYDGHHRLSIIRYLKLDPIIEISTDWSSVGIDPTKMIGRDFPLVEMAKSIWGGREQLYHYVSDNRLKDFSIQRPDSTERRDYILKNLVGKTVLDIGCSEGYLCHEIAKKKKYKVTGIEMGYDIKSNERGRKLIAITRYLSIIQSVKMKCLLGDWKDIIREQDFFSDNILYLSVLHNEINAIKGKALENLKLFRGKTKRLFVEIPDIYKQPDWAKIFNMEKFIPFIQKQTGLQVIEIWNGYRPIILLENKI